MRKSVPHGLVAAAFWVWLALTGAGSVLPAMAHIVTETPWHPLAAGYRTMMFMGDLKPTPWRKIRAAFDEPITGATSAKSARAKLAELKSPDATAAISAITRAIKAGDRQALYETSSRAIAIAIRAHLTRAAANLGTTSRAAAHVSEAQDLYRAISDFIRQADGPGYKKLGRAWLTLTSALGPARMGRARGRGPDRKRFAAAHMVIDVYLSANYQPRAFSRRSNLAPVPETIAAAGTPVKIAPWLPPGTNLNDQDPLPLLVLNFEERGIDEAKLPLVAYGDMLFDSPLIFGGPARALGITCSTCHNRSDINRSLFIPGISHQAGAVDVDGHYFNPKFNDHRDDSLDTPSLRGLRFTGPYGRDGRFASLREFTRNVIVGEFAGKEPTAFMLDTLVSYMLEFDFLPNAKITGDGRLTDKASDAAKRGEKLFRKPFAQMDGKSCASCHIPSANFLDRRAHDIGSKMKTYPNSRDGAFDTPTLLGARFTAPYFHDGSVPTLAAVVDWFDKRYQLNLSTGERADLTAYVEAIGDADQAYEIYRGKHTPFRLAFEELTTFASTLDTLLPARDAFHAKLMIDTVSADLSADASGMTNLSAKPKVYELSSKLAAVGTAIDAGNWALAGRHWAAFKKMQKHYDGAMY